MAKKRMFTLTVVDSDAFLEMPLSAQALYFHLNMRADDDGFIGNPKRVQSYVGASSDDLKLLIAKRFVIAFDDGVIVIKHWRMHNTIQKDRYTPTSYQDELSELVLKANKSYKIGGCGDLDTKWKQNVSTGLDIGIGLDKDIDKEKESTKERPPYFDVENAWIETYKIYPKKSGEATAKIEWMKKVGNALDIKEVSKLVFFATKLYLSDYSGKYPDDVNYKFLPRYDKWLQEDCDYWIRQYEEKQRGDDS